jgi:hypothetical protein
LKKKKKKKKKKKNMTNQKNISQKYWKETSKKYWIPIVDEIKNFESLQCKQEDDEDTETEVE